MKSLSPHIPVELDLMALRTATLSCLRRVVGSREIALIDYPAHYNCGDHLIWKGTRSYLKRLGVTVILVADERSYSRRALARLAPNVPILLQGGGNFGDLWPRTQRFRERVIRDHPDRRIVQLPQTVFFRDRSAMSRTNALLSRHEQFTLLVRDSSSMHRAAEGLADVATVFCPDLALGTPTPAPSHAGGRGVLVLARSDVEASGAGRALRDNLRSLEKILGPVRVADWGLRGFSSLVWGATRVLPRLLHAAPVMHRFPGIESAIDVATRVGSDRVVSSAQALFDGADLVITDRLHGHIWAGLCAIPHVAVDNSYGKVGGIFADYTHCLPGAHFASGPKAAAELARDLLRY